MGIEEARRLWRALGFPEVGDEQRVFTSADVAALTDAAGLVAGDIVDTDGLVELARPLGHLLSRLAAAQTGFIFRGAGCPARCGSGMAVPEAMARMRAAAYAEGRLVVDVARDVLRGNTTMER